jgi:hypothetical protein
MSLKEILDKVWNDHGVEDPLRKCRWKEYGTFIKSCHSHYRVAPIKVKGSLANSRRH